MLFLIHINVVYIDIVNMDFIHYKNLVKLPPFAGRAVFQEIFLLTVSVKK